MAELLTILETADRLHVSRATVYRLIRDRRLAVTKVRNSTFVTMTELERFVKVSERGRLA